MTFLWIGVCGTKAEVFVVANHRRGIVCNHPSGFSSVFSSSLTDTMGQNVPCTCHMSKLLIHWSLLEVSLKRSDVNVSMFNQVAAMSVVKTNHSAYTGQ